MVRLKSRKAEFLTKCWCSFPTALCLLIGAVGIAGCGGGGPHAKTLVLNTSLAPSTLDPAEITANGDLVLGNFYVRLLDYGHKPGSKGTFHYDPSHITPYLAKSWSISGSGRVYTFKLKLGLRFASGTPVDAKAVKFTYERELKTPGAFSLDDGIPGNITSIEAPRADTLTIRLRTADPGILKAFAASFAGIVDPSVVARHGKDWLGSHEAGSGPFRLVSYVPNQRLILESRAPFEQWYGRKNGARRIIVNFVNSDPTLLVQARSSTADVTLYLGKQSVNSLKGERGLTLVVDPGNTAEQMLLPWNKAPWNSRLVREAVAYAVPYDDIVSKSAYGLGTPFYGPLLPTMRYFNKQLSAPPAFDVSRAKKLIQQSGIKTPINVTVTIDEGNAAHARIATVLQSIWRQIGINMKVQTLSAADYANALFGGKVQAAIRNDGPGIVDPGFYLGYDLRCKVIGIGSNLSHACIKAADPLLDRARLSTSDSEKQRIYDRVTTLWRANWPKVIFYSDENVVVLAKHVIAKSWLTGEYPDLRTLAKS